MRSKVPVFRETTMKFSDLARQYLNYLGSYRGYSPRTISCYDLTYMQFRTFLQTRGLLDSVDAFNADVVQDFAAFMAASGLKSSSISIKLAGLSSLARCAMRTKHKNQFVLDENPVQRVERPQRVRQNRVFLHRDELERLVRLECAAHERIVLDLFLDTACRASELANANVGDLQEVDDGLVLTVTVKRAGGSVENRSPWVASRLSGRSCQEVCK